MDGTHAFVAVSGSDSVLKIDLASGKVVGRLAFDSASTPYQVRLSRDGRLYVALQGAAHVAEVDTGTMTISRMIATGRPRTISSPPAIVSS